MDKRKASDALNNANIEIEFLNKEKASSAKELEDAYKKIAFQIEEKGKRAAELAIANIELIFQNEEKEKRAAELVVANNELVFQNKEKEKRALELSLANKELKTSENALRKLYVELEQKVNKRTAQYAFISQVNQTIIHVNDEETLFRNACNIAVEFGKFKMAWIGLFDSELQKIRLLQSSGIPKQAIKHFTDVLYEKNSPQDLVFSTGKYYVCKDIRKDLVSENWKSYTEKHGIRSCILVPIKKSGKIFGTFSLYASELNFFNEEDIRLAVEVAGDISFALDLFENAKKHKDTEEQILKNEKRFRALIENSADMITLSSKEGKMLYGSPSITKLFGYTTEDILNKSAFEYIHPDDILIYAKNRKKLLESPGKSFQNQIRLKHKNGKWIWCESTISNQLHEPGIHAMVSNFRDITEKKLIETQQEFDHNNLNALINNTNDLMWSIDRDFNLITSNLPFDEIGKLSFGKAIAKGESVLAASYTPEMLKHFKQLYERAFAGESFTKIEHFTYPAEVWTEISYHPMRKGDEIIGAACHSRDITGIKNTEKQLIKSEAFNRGVLNSLSAHIAVVDSSGKIVAVNDAWNRFAKENGDTNLQHTSVGTNYYSVCNRSLEPDVEIAQEVILGMKNIIEDKEKNYYLEYPCHSPLKQRWFGMRALKFESDAPMIVVSHTNISERKLAENNLLQSEARLNEAQALTNISNWALDLATNVTTWSDEFFRILGFEVQAIKPSHDTFLSMIHPEDYEFVKARMEKAFQTLESGYFESRIKRNNGKIRFIYSEWKFEFDKNKKPIRLYGILQDITDRKVAEQEKEKLTKDILQRNQDLEQFTFIISHNLRAPTANIIGLTEILKDEKLTPQEQKELLQGLSSSVFGLDTIIKDINVILQVKKEVNERKVMLSFSKLVHDILTSIENTIDKQHVQIKSDFSEVDAFFSIKIFVHSIFYNLISNSIKYRKPDKPVLIEIKSKKEKGKIKLTFKDNGLGIDLKTKSKKVFGLYKRFHSHVEGKGMGLYMVKTQVEALGGNISVESELNKGTEFTIEFNN